MVGLLYIINGIQLHRDSNGYGKVSVRGVEGIYVLQKHDSPPKI